MNQTANQTTFDLIDKLLNASSAAAGGGNRSSRAANSPSTDPFRGVDLFDEASQDLLNDLDSLPGFTKMQRAIMAAFSRNLLSTRARGWRILFDDLKTFVTIPRSSMSTMQSIFNNAVDKVSWRFLFPLK